MRENLHQPRCCSTLPSKVSNVKVCYYYIKILRLLLQISNILSLGSHFPRRVLLKLQHRQYSPERAWQCRLLDPTCRVSNWGLVWGLKICIFNKFPGITTDGARLGTTLESYYPNIPENLHIPCILPPLLPLKNEVPWHFLHKSAWLPFLWFIFIPVNSLMPSLDSYYITYRNVPYQIGRGFLASTIPKTNQAHVSLIPILLSDLPLLQDVAICSSHWNMIPQRTLTSWLYHSSPFPSCYGICPSLIWK